MDLEPGMDPANPHDDIPLYLRDEPPVILHEREDHNWLALRVTHGPDSVWLYTFIEPTEAVELLAAGDPDALDAAVTRCTTGRFVTMATAYEGRITSTGTAFAAATPLATAHQWITTGQ